jgi:peptidyl-prolyl cis-trans isomerase C
MNHSRLTVLVLILAALSACQMKGEAAKGGDTSAPVATVDGTPISRDFYEYYVKGLTQGKSSADLTAQQRSAALDGLIRAQLVAEEANKQGLDKSGEAMFAPQLAKLQVLEQAVEQNYMKDRKPTDDELRAEYQTELSTLPKTEYHVRHILVATQPFAQKVIERLDKGEKFDALAKELSMDSTKNNGGDLQWLTPNRMPPEFAGAVVALKPGDYTHQPVKTQFGWHVIQVLETRDVNPPPFEQVRGRLEQIVMAKKFRQYTDELMHNAKIERFIDQPTTTPAPAAGGTSPPPAAPATSPAPANN